MVSNMLSLSGMPTMHPATAQAIHGRKRARATIVKPKKAKASTAKIQKKAVNSFVIYRSLMSPLYPNYTQAERSRFVRTMWEKEEHKTTFSLMARVWTFIRDNSTYRCLPQFLAGCGLITEVAAPNVWLNLYHMMLVRLPNGVIDLVQTAVPAPGRIPTPRNLSDYDLLHQLILKGLPLERPAQLLAQLGEHSLHVMTVDKQQDFSSIDETLGAAGRAVTGFTQQTNYNPISTFADLLDLDSSNEVFNYGVNIIDVPDITNFDDSNVLVTGPQTHYRFEWDTTTIHHAQPQSGAVPSFPNDDPMMFDMDQPNMWDVISGQVTQREYQAQHGKVDNMNMEDFFMPTSFDSYPQLDLE